MAELAIPKADFLYREFVDQNVKKLVENETIWEGMLTHQSVNALNIRYFREQYVDIETPNDAVLGVPIDTLLKSPNYRAPGALFPHTTFGEPKEYNLGLYQLALEVDIPDETQKYVEFESQILRAQRKLGNSFASRVNAILGGKLSEDWTASPSNIQVLTASAVWDVPTASTCNPVQDILDSAEKVESVAGYAYKPEGVYMSKQSYFDLRAWLVYKNLSYTTRPIDVAQKTEVLMVEGFPIHKSDMVKRDFALIGDFKQAGILYESEPLATRQYYTDADRVTHVQVNRTFNFALTDPKAICTIYNLAT
jgi:hypothetical protein